ncbi:hypothetical protein [Campylobacter portucalensis]|uniref:hypothetical protein n=1 Tax=Campylobacter portucalensis TaxID=2608384 RepID=UPI0012B2DD27|nr:hypothetical protein [Campylobacter portucalensis]
MAFLWGHVDLDDRGFVGLWIDYKLFYGFIVIMTYDLKSISLQKERDKIVANQLK